MVACGGDELFFQVEEGARGEHTALIASSTRFLGRSWSIGVVIDLSVRDFVHLVAQRAGATA